jgi:tyrosyl-tRNA synthetase
MHPKQAKLKLAREIVAKFYGTKVADEELNNFEKAFSQKQTPDDIEEYVYPSAQESLADVLVKKGMVESKNEARRLIQQGAVSLDGEKIQDENWSLRPGVLKVGKRRFLRLKRA